MNKPTYEKPALLSHTAIKFETLVSGSGKFPGLGHGVDGVPAKERGDFPGKGATDGIFPGKGPTHGHRP